MNSLFHCSLLLLITATSGAIAGGENPSKIDSLLQAGGSSLLKDSIKELPFPTNHYETLGEQKIFTPYDIHILDGQDMVEILVDTATGFNKKGNEDALDALTLATKIYLREKALSAVSSQMPDWPNIVQENPKFQHTLTASIKTGARFGLDFFVDSITGTLYNMANSNQKNK